MIGLIALILVATLVTWALYIYVMGLKKRRDDLSRTQKAFGYLVLTIGVVVDLLYNIFIGTIVFLDPPRELLFTSRLQRYVHGPCAKWRFTIADFMCRRMLDPFDPGHCS